jgi:hypothetical protein
MVGDLETLQEDHIIRALLTLASQRSLETTSHPTPSPLAQLHRAPTLAHVGEYAPVVCALAFNIHVVHHLRPVQPFVVATPLWGKCEVATHTFENGTWESFGTPENSEFDCRGQNTSPWCVLYTIGKVLKFKCPKWPLMSHLDICSTSYGRKKGRKSNWQFDSWPLKVGNWPDPGASRWSATHCWKALEESYKFASDLIPIGGLSWELWMPKVPRVQTGTVSGLHFGSPGK